MAAVRVGAIPQSCGKCQRDPSLKECWGCNEPLQTVVERLPDDNFNPIEYYSCPLLFISKSVNAFLEKYDAIKTGFAAPSTYEHEEAKFFEMKSYYERWESIFKEKIAVAKNG